MPFCAWHCTKWPVGTFLSEEDTFDVLYPLRVYFLTGYFLTPQPPHLSSLGRRDGSHWQVWKQQYLQCWLFTKQARKNYYYYVTRNCFVARALAVREQIARDSLCCGYSVSGGWRHLTSTSPRMPTASGRPYPCRFLDWFRTWMRRACVNTEATLVSLYGL